MGKVRLIGLFISLIIVLTILNNLESSTGLLYLYQKAEAHFFGVPVLQNKTVGEHKIVFQPYPTIPAAGDNSTKINLSILDKDNQNINAVFASISVKEKDTGQVLKNFPYGFYEFSDMTFSYTFPNVGTYVVTLQSKINGDPVYTKMPLLVDFELPVGSGNNYLSFSQTLTAYLIVALALIAAIVIYLRTENKI